MGTEFTEYEFEKAIKHVKSSLQQRGVDINSALKQLFSKDSDILRDTAKSYIRGVEPKRVVMDFKRGHEVLNEFDVQMLVYIRIGSIYLHLPTKLPHTQHQSHTQKHSNQLSPHILGFVG